MWKSVIHDFRARSSDSRFHTAFRNIAPRINENALYLRDEIEKLSIQSELLARYSHDPHRLNKPRVNKGIWSETFQIQCTRPFHGLPRSIKESDAISGFKKKIESL